MWIVINERYFMIFLNNFLKLDNLNGRHMCIIPYQDEINTSKPIRIFITKFGERFTLRV